MAKKGGQALVTGIIGMKDDIRLIWQLLKDPRIPKRYKLVASVAGIYTVSPIDLIPDKVPVLGWLDELFVVTVTARWFLGRAYKKAPKAFLEALSDTHPAFNAFSTENIVAAWTLLTIAPAERDQSWVQLKDYPPHLLLELLKVIRQYDSSRFAEIWNALGESQNALAWRIHKLQG